ncbi:MAG: hypothetical protein DDT27_00524 [Dehalococcoidia bacterium]|nr:hypothetical protein [Chloroflexota bacterium]MBT9161981.1 hypothetical protein [Chloroflexota bacterium]
MLKRLSFNGIEDHYKLPIVSLCFLISVCLNLFFTQGSVAFDALAWTCTVALVGAVLGSTLPRSAHSYLLFVVLGTLVIGIGFFESASVILWLASSWSLGVLVLRRLHSKEDLSLISPTEAILIGAAIWLAIWGVMLHFEVNFQSLHIVLCLLPCFLILGQKSTIHNELHSRLRAADDWMRSIPFWSWVGGLIVVSWVFRWASFPSMGFDDHVLHLRIWTELLTSHRYSFDISTQIWAVAPFTVSLLHAGLSLMAGGDARSAMNLCLAILLLLLMTGILRRLNMPVWAQWLLIVLMATTPMLGNLLLTLQTELALAVITVAGMRLVMDASGGWRGQHVLGVLSCAALLASIKLPGAVLGVTLLAALAVRWWSQREATSLTGHMLRWPALLLLIPLGFVALHSYGVAWKLTGNPVFPLFNGIFLSPYFEPINFSDPRWIHGFSFASYVRAFFHTSEFFESGNYTAGWQYLIMLPIALLALLRSRTPSVLRIILIPLLGFGLVMFAATQYWRYLFPVMPLAVVLIGSLFIQEKPAIRTVASILSLACIAANLLFFTRVSWMMNSPPGLAFTPDGKETLISLYAPASLLTKRVNQLAPGSRVLYSPNTPYGATLHGIPVYRYWYQPFRYKALNSVNDLDGLRDFISKEKIDFSILEMTVTSDLQDVLLREFMSKFGYVEGQSNNFLLYRISGMPVKYLKVFELQKSEGMAPGKIDFMLPVTGEGVTASTDGKELAVIPTHSARQARYKVDFTCLSNIGYFVAQINWDKGPPYYRLVACESKSVTFVEAIPIPIGAIHGLIYVKSRETSSIQVKNITVEVN